MAHSSRPGLSGVRKSADGRQNRLPTRPQLRIGGISWKFIAGTNRSWGNLFANPGLQAEPRCYPFTLIFESDSPARARCCFCYSSPKYLFRRRLFVRELTPRLRFFSVARERHFETNRRMP